MATMSTATATLERQETQPAPGAYAVRGGMSLLAMHFGMRTAAPAAVRKVKTPQVLPLTRVG
jgi:hypothetical protein